VRVFAKVRIELSSFRLLRDSLLRKDVFSGNNLLVYKQSYDFVIVYVTTLYIMLLRRSF